MRVAVFGSRKGVTLTEVGKYLNARIADVKRITVISGGADGVDRYAEVTWTALGGSVISLRPAQFGEDTWGVECWELNLPDTPSRMFRLVDHPTFEEFKGAAIYRDMLIAEWADRGVAFRAGKYRSRGTTGTIGFFGALDKPCAVYDEEDRNESVQEQG